MKFGQAGNTRWRYAAIASAAIAIGAVYAYWLFCWGAPTTVILVRHADRENGADALSVAGTARAQELARVLAKSDIRAIYTSDAVRTQQTAAPTAGLLGIAPEAVVAVADLVGAIRANHRSHKVLVVGHSNTVPEIVAEFGGPVVAIADNEFDNLYVLTVCRCRRSGVGFVNLQYGSASP